MKLVTVSRERGAGGGEVAGRLAKTLGRDLLDHELLHRVAELEHLADSKLEALDERAVTLSDRFRKHQPHHRFIHGLAEASRQAADGDHRVPGVLYDFLEVRERRVDPVAAWRGYTDVCKPDQ